MTCFIESTNNASLRVCDAVVALKSLDASAVDFGTSVADILKGLYNNRNMLSEIMAAALEEPGNAQFYSPQSFYIDSGDFRDGRKFMLRGNVWLPASFEHDAQSLENFVYSYDNCHDHNFDFYTVGYAGPGYVTDLYEYDAEQTIGLAGERVGLKSMGTVQLGPGQILYFRKGIDAHKQGHPDALSISLNVLIHDEDQFDRAQYEFEPSQGIVKNTIYTSSMRATSLAFLIGQFGCSDVAEEAFRQLRSSRMWQHRHAAGRALIGAGVRSDLAALNAELDLAPSVPLGIEHGLY